MNRRERRLQPPAARRRVEPVVAQPESGEPAKPWWQNDWVILATMLLGFAIYRFIVFSNDPGPPGSDAGNWLAFTKDLFGGHVKSANSMYFPGALVLLRFLMIWMSDLNALKALAVIASLSTAVPFYFLARMACNKATSIVLTALWLMTGFMLEMMSWGGYPQLLASACSLGTLYFVDRWLYEGQRNDLIRAAVLTGLVAITHHFMLIVLILTLAIYGPFVAYKLRSDVRIFARRVLKYGGAAALACLVSLPWYIQYLSLLAGKGSLDATQGQFRGLSGMVSYVFAEAPLTWIVLCTLVPAISLLPFGDEGTRRLRPIAISILIAPMLVYAAVHEHRAIQQGQVGALLCLGMVAAYCQSYLSRLTLSKPVLFAGRATLAMAAIALLLIIVPNSDSRQHVALSRFDAMDAQAVQALDFLRNDTPKGSVVLPGNRHGVVNYAWWVEGFGQRPAYGLIDPHFLAFKQEIEQATVAARITRDDTPLDEAQKLLTEANIRYLFIYKPSGGDFQRIADGLPMTVAFQNDEFIIFQLPVQTATAHE